MRPRLFPEGSPVRLRVALAILDLGGVLMILGGVGDILLGSPPAAWESVVGAPFASLPDGAAVLPMALLSALGSSLVGCGLAVLALVNGPLRQGDRWATPVIALVALGSEGVNAMTMARLGVPYFWGPVFFLALIGLGLVVAEVPRPAARPLPDVRRTRYAGRR